MLKEYKVTLQCSETFTIQAENEEEALEAALDKAVEIAELDWECDNVSTKE
ncbi:hypothetical protein [Enterococcus sp. BWR-S5]|uniref:hypothetical protein n=1 Tax=Enterococcus sp. BWR-S5 TaxID=2787714 RepID=UPI001924A8F9|nr:hypothetical protein [Enterococcus sp. BWR-S5]MBL1227261.1 hypothetical protein [Enterococcus sp. BWR-S5]